MIKIIRFIFLWMLAPCLMAHMACYPVFKPGKASYLIGYGSLIQAQSRMRTIPDANHAMPVWVQGWQRGFILRSTYQPGTTFLGVRRDPKAHFNAVMFRVSAADIWRADQREHDYCRYPLKRGDLVSMQGVLPAGDYWMYVPQHVTTPSKAYPLVQSYVDLFVGGCIEVADHFHLPRFVAQCIRTTHDWSRYWVNDRIYPRRPYIYQPLAFKIDHWLRAEHVVGLTGKPILHTICPQ